MTIPSFLRLSALFALFTFSAPAALIYVADQAFAPGTGAIRIVDEAGGVTDFVTGLVGPRAVAFRGGVLLVADDDQIKQYDTANGAALPSLGTLVGVDSIVVDLLGNVFAASSSAGVITRYDAGGGPATTLNVTAPGALALDGLGNLFVMYDNGVNGMQGHLLSTADLSYVNLILPLYLGTAMAATYDGGDLYISDLFGGVDRVDSSGTLTSFASSGLSFPWGVLFDGNGLLNVANSSDGAIYRYGSTGAYHSTLVAPATSLLSPTGMALSPIPEPGTWALCAGALVALGFSRGAFRASSPRG
jgi:sugar lactone lactonase YvrE